MVPLYKHNVDATLGRTLFIFCLHTVRYCNFYCMRHPRIDTVLLHQCSEPRSLGPLFELLANTSLSLVQRRGFFHPETRFISVNKEQYENTFFCMDEVEVDYLMRSFNDARVVQGVRREVFAYLGLDSPGTLQTLVSSNALRNGCHTHMRKLKFGLYERPESDLNRRLITNKKAVLSLFKTISKEHTTVFHVSRNDDLQELIDKFNNFDIVVHLGVHLGGNFCA